VTDLAGARWAADVAALGWAAFYAAASMTAVVRAAVRVRARTSRTTGSAPGVVLLRPLAGAERDLETRLAYAGGATHVVFAVGSARDPAHAAAARAAEILAAHRVRAEVVVTTARGPNHKVDQLARALASVRSRRPVTHLVVADSDVALDDGAVGALVSALDEPGSGADAAWAPPVESGAVLTAGDALSRAVLDASLHAFPLLASIDPGGLVGKLFVIRTSALDAIGGLEALTHHLGEDMEIARRLRTGGRGVVVAPIVARSVASGRSLATVLERYRRWLLVIRAQRTALLPSYPLLLAAAPLACVLAAMALATHDLLLGAAAAVVIATRVVVACAARRHAGLPLAPFVAAGQAMLADGTLLVALGAALASRRVGWRGAPLVIGRHGRLEPRDAAASASGGKESDEQLLGETRERARPTDEDRREPAALRIRAGREELVDARELALDPVALRGDTDQDLACMGERSAERDEEIRLLGLAEHVAETDGDDDGVLRDARHLRGARAELERREGRTLTPLRKDPQRAPGAIEELGRVPDAACAVGRIVEVHAERPHLAEEGHLPEVRGVHHRVAVGRKEQLGHPDHEERVPPGRVVQNEQHGAALEQRPHAIEVGHEHATERAADARARMPREERDEPRALRRGNHEATR